jgi:hypothetical protein
VELSINSEVGGGTDTMGSGRVKKSEMGAVESLDVRVYVA